MILVFDTIKDDDASFRFNRSISRILNNNYKYEIKRLYGSNLNIDFADYDRLIISGSELSASIQHIEQNDVFTLINEFVFMGKPILGICYGHQMIARALGGDECCRRAETFEFGFTKVKIEDNPLFAGITNPVFMQSHFDEVVNHEDTFNIIAHNSNAKVQAFQWGENPVWGVQFHPELNYAEGSSMLTRNLHDDELVKDYANYDCADFEQADQNDQVIINFCNV